jgi:hypothetical protein
MLVERQWLWRENRGGKSTPHQAVQCNNLARARRKLNAGADVNHEEDLHVMNTPRQGHLAAQSGRPLARCLISNEL